MTHTGSVPTSATRRVTAIAALPLVLLATLIAWTVAQHPHPDAHPAAIAARITGPAGKQVVLARGDTLWSLARRHGTTVAALQQANHLGRSTLIYAGHRLVLPTGPVTHARTPSAPRTGRRLAAGPGRTAVDFARRQVGVPYRWGGTGRSGFDCSGLVQAAWHAAGIDLPRTTFTQIHVGTRISRARLRPGDLVFTHSGRHVQLYAGHGHVIEAARPGTTVGYSPLPPAHTVDAYLRPTPTGRR
ncbi:C40 family peptidase [Streptomyces sp. NPDC015684]|uniref:C40 family peptidase n=1 Tax=Streptomyces sp. NPDC015684 TaxID=3364963 RepID=UPI0036F4EC6C